MSHHQQRGEKELGNITMKDSFGILQLLFGAHAFSVGIWMRRNYGSQAVGWTGLYAFILIALYATFTNSQAMFVYLGLFLCMQVVQRVTSIRREWQGKSTHSYSWGDSELAREFGIRSETIAKGVFEPLFCLVVGAVLSLTLSEELGAFVMLGCISIAGQWSIQKAVNRARVRHRRDAEIEMQYQEALYRGDVK